MGPRKPTQVSQGSRLPEVPSGRRGLVDLLAATRRHRLGSHGDCLAEVPDEGASQWVSGEAPPPACRRPSSLRPHRASPWDTLREQAHPRGLIQLQSPPRTTGPLSQTSWGQSSVRNRDTREADKASVPFRPSLALLGPGGDRSWPSGPARHAPTHGSSVGTATARSACRHHPWCPHHPDQAPWSLFSSQAVGPPEQPPASSGFRADSPFWPREYHDSGSEPTDEYCPSSLGLWSPSNKQGWPRSRSPVASVPTEPGHAEMDLVSGHLQPSRPAVSGDFVRGPKLPFPQMWPGAAPALWPFPA